MSNEWIMTFSKKNDEIFFKKSNKNISKKKIFSWEILQLTWYVISMLENFLTDYSYHWCFYSCEIFKISVFYFYKQMEFNVIKGYYSLTNQHIKIL